MEKNELYISIGITFIFCGALFYYCHTRIKNIENAVTNQNQILSSFITNVKDELQPNLSENSGGLVKNNINKLASDEALAAVKQMKNNNLIEVSDTETNDDSDSDSDSDSDTNYDSDEESERVETENNESMHQKNVLNNNNNNNNNLTETSTMNSNLGSFHLDSEVVMLSTTNTIDDIKVIEILANMNHNQDKLISGENKIIELNDHSSDDDDDSDKEEDYEKVSIRPINIDENGLFKLETVQITNDDSSTITTTKNIPLNNIESVNIEKLKVDDLRQNAILKGLLSKEDAKKIKKPELVALLKKDN